MDDQSTDPRPAGGPDAPTRDEAVMHAIEALLTAREAVESMTDGSDRIYALDQLASRWLDVADRLESNAPVKASGCAREGQSPSARYPDMAYGVQGAHKGVQRFQARALDFGPDMPTVHLWQGVAYPEGSAWDVPGDPTGATGGPSTWTVGCTKPGDQPVFVSPTGAHTASLTVLTAMEGTPTRVMEDVTVFKCGGVQYPLGTVWTDKDGDRWRVAGRDERGELRMVDESTKDPEFMPQYVEGETVYCSPLAEVLQRWGPITRAEDDAIHLV